MTSRILRSRAALVVLAALAAVVAAVVFAVVAKNGAPPLPRIWVHAEDFQRTVIYHSPQAPGYTAWTGAWMMPDGSLMTAFTQATGPIDPKRRTRAPSSILRKMTLRSWAPRWDFWGLTQSVKYLRSSDRGTTWKLFRSDPFKALTPHGYTPQATVALDDGTIVRRINGYDLRYDDSVPHTAYLQRLATGAKSWSKPQVVLNPAKYTYQLSRLRRLRDGRLIATGGVWNVPAGTVSPQAKLNDAPGGPLLIVSKDQGKTWANGLTIPPDVSVAGEWDTAELPNGDLLAVFRTTDPARSNVPIRRQALLEKHGARWVLTEVKDSPFPHSGHPELVATREGVVLHIASTGVHYTSDGGNTWAPLRFSPPISYTSKYYPRAVQTDDGTIYIFSHRGSDNYYGERDQAIVMDRFRLVKEEAIVLGLG